MDSLRVLDTDPVDYLVTPRVLACMIAGPILNVLCFCMGERRGLEERGSFIRQPRRLGQPLTPNQALQCQC